MKNPIVCILGMHKSGTTLISQILHYSDISMGSFDVNIGYDEGNQYERRETQDLNREFLDCGEKLSIDVINTPAAKDFDKNTALANKLIAEIDSAYSTMWGFKDPRTCLTFPIWKAAIEKNTYYVVAVFRSPVANWHHYQKNVPKYRLLKRLIRGVTSLRAWYVYNALMMEALDGLDKTQFEIFAYENFLDDDKGFNKLQSLLDRQLQDRRNKKMQRSNKKPNFGYRLSKVCCKLFHGADIDSLWKNLRSLSSDDC